MQAKQRNNLQIDGDFDVVQLRRLCTARAAPAPRAPAIGGIQRDRSGT